MSSKRGRKENTIHYSKEQEDGSLEEKKEKKIGVFSLVIYLTISILVSVLAYYQLFKTDYSFMLDILKIDSNEVTSQKLLTETKFTLLFFPWVSIAMLLLIVTVHIVGFRIFTGRPDALRNENNRVMNALNRVLLNTMEQSFIFLGVYSFLVFKNKMNVSESIAFSIAFIVARFVYAFGYMIQGMTNFILIRATGMTITIFVNIVLVGKLFGISFNTMFLKHLV